MLATLVALTTFIWIFIYINSCSIDLFAKKNYMKTLQRVKILKVFAYYSSSGLVKDRCSQQAEINKKYISLVTLIYQIFSIIIYVYTGIMTVISPFNISVWILFPVYIYISFSALLLLFFIDRGIIDISITYFVLKEIK
ncbi:MAG: hypothetical protein LBV51_04445 [Acholeplasmatales bacterium]|jgi:hypothetical protein|nr:hypothetical protein [Acholeplasmatales bacterium]